jgi:D-beta-D-heptose 7-phosphate kinase/D-beta-D-heptose 1-phosphate adenosyltransferase
MHDRNNRIVVVSGGFDPVHTGHILLLNSAKTLGDYLIVGVNSDKWLQRKKGQAFMSWSERSAIVNNMKAVDEVMAFDDSDGSACHLLKKVKAYYPGFPIIFANGGDRTAGNIPELAVKDILFEFGIGGSHKQNSSSSILYDWTHHRVDRPWGYYRVLYDAGKYKVKELVINPGNRLSMQRHQHRSENWFVLRGECAVETEYLESVQTLKVTENNSYSIGAGVWHQGQNNTNADVHILEVQYGTECIEEDIERK